MIQLKIFLLFFTKHNLLVNLDLYRVITEINRWLVVIATLKLIFGLLTRLTNKIICKKLFVGLNMFMFCNILYVKEKSRNDQ